MRELQTSELKSVVGGFYEVDKPEEQRGGNGDNGRDRGERGERHPGGIAGEIRDGVRDMIGDILATTGMIVDSIIDAVAGDSGRSKDHSKGVSCPSNKDLVDGNCVTPGQTSTQNR